MAEPPEKKEKICHSCGLDDQGQSTLLDAAGAAKAFAELPADLWTLEEKRLTRKFTAKNFMQAVAFVNAVRAPCRNQPRDYGGPPESSRVSAAELAAAARSSEEGEVHARSPEL